MITVKAEIDENGNVKILEPVSFSGTRRALLVVLDEPVALPEPDDDEENIGEAELEAEDRLWEQTFERHADKFAALKAQALAEIAEGKTIDAFDENGEFAL